MPLPHRHGLHGLSALAGFARESGEDLDKKWMDFYEMDLLEPTSGNQTNDKHALAHKHLPKPPSRLHTLRHSMANFDVRTKAFTDRLQGYHFGIWVSAITTAIVLVINLIWITVMASRYRVIRGIGTIQEGSCRKTNSLAMWLHLLINILSTLLLGCSNYTMQCLSSPTRRNVDKAHREGVSLDIGVPSMRNLGRISKIRLFIWLAIATSSLPLHLLYNSAVFSTLSARQYSVFIVTEDFLTGAPFNLSAAEVNGSTIIDDGNPVDPQISQQAQELRAKSSSLEIMKNGACKNAFSSVFISRYTNFLIIASGKNATNSVLGYYPNVSPDFEGNGRQYKKITGIITGSEWRLGNFDIQYCLSQTVEEHCKLQYSAWIMAVVILANFVKMGCMFWLTWQQPKEPLITLGDAIASFLDDSDEMTKGSCLANKRDFTASGDWDRAPRAYQSRKGGPSWFNAAGRFRWYFCNIL